MSKLYIRVLNKTGVEKIVAVKSGSLIAQDNINYMIVEEPSNLSLNQLDFRRSGNNLTIITDEGNFNINNYFSVKNVDIIGIQNGTYFSYDVTSNGPHQPLEKLLADEVSTNNLGGESYQQALTTAQAEPSLNFGTPVTASSPVGSIPLLAGIGALGLAGAALAGSRSSKSNTPSKPTSPSQNKQEITIDGDKVEENINGALVGKLEAIDSKLKGPITFSLQNHIDKFEIIDNVLKLKDGISMDYDALKSHPNTDFPSSREAFEYNLEITAQDHTGQTITKTVTISINNQYEGVTDQKDLPYFLEALYDKNTHIHATTPNGWGTPRMTQDGEDWTDLANIIGKGRKIVWGFGDPNHADNSDNTDRKDYTAAQKDAIRKALNHFETLFKLDIEERIMNNNNYSTSNNEFDIVFYRSNFTDGSLGYTSLFYPKNPVGNDLNSNLVFMNSNYYGDNENMQSGDGYRTLLHEIGHALGLEHVGSEVNPPSPPYLPLSEDFSSNTVMSYNSDIFKNELAMYDKITLEYMYGLNNSYRSGDDTYNYSSNTHYIGDGSGNDTIDFSSISDDVYLNLTPGSWGYIGEQENSILDDGQFFIGYDTDIETLITGNGNDTLFASKQGSSIFSAGGNDVVNGNIGNDSIFAGEGADIIFGGGGNDVIDGGAGDDIIFFDSNTSINGGEGFDILNIGTSGEVTLSANITNIEVISLSKSDAQNISLDINDVLDMTDNNNILKINGTDNDVVQVSGFTMSGNESGYYVYTDGNSGAQLMVENGITVI